MLSNPGYFRNFTAAKMAAEAYHLEEHEPWVVMYKYLENGEGTYMVYVAVRLSETFLAETEGYKLYSEDS